MSFPKIEPIKLKEYTTKQSKYPQAAKLPIRSIVLGPSGSGKTILLQNFIMDIYDGAFEKKFVLSRSDSFRSHVATSQGVCKRKDETRY